MNPDDEKQSFRVGSHTFCHPTPERIAFLGVIGVPLSALVKRQSGGQRKASAKNLEDLVFALSRPHADCIAVLSRGYDKWRAEASAFRETIGGEDYLRIVFQLAWTFRENCSK